MSEASARTTDEIGEALSRWIGEHWDPDLSLVDWRRRLVAAGWACAGWPREWGGLGLSTAAAESVLDALADHGVPGPPESVGTRLAVPTLLEHGSDELKRELLERSATGEIVWCQLFSEPGAGSDLAGLSTRAQLDGDEWVVSGEKVWNTGAAQADLGLLLARTDWSVPKHQGITCFVLPMRQRSVDVRPLRQMNGHASFNEVFLDEARLPRSWVVGAIGGGWRVALTALAYERRLGGSGRKRPRRDAEGRAWREATAEQRAASEPYKWYPQRAGRVDLLVERASATGRCSDPAVRQELARVLALASAARWTSQRAAAARALGHSPGPEGSLGKLATSVIAREASHAHGSIAGASGLLAGDDAPLGGTITEIFVSVPGQSIAGGTDEVQKNILAERVLGLPRESSSDKDLPFDTLRDRPP